MEIRDLEKTGYFGYLFFIKYDGTKFDSFDEAKNIQSIKGEFKNILIENNIIYYKGIQQAGRTDKDVSARENILYINSKQDIKFENLKQGNNFLKITDIKKTMPYLEIPGLIEKRHYVYTYPKGRIKNTEAEIIKRCEELSGLHDVSNFTTKKGQKLKEKVRSLQVEYDDGKLNFIGSSFMPQQVRIMSSYILNNKKQPLEGKYLVLEKIILSKKLTDMIIYEDNTITEENIERVEKNKEFIFFYVKKSKKGEVIGTKGKNIKGLRSKYGKIVIKEI